MGHQIVDRHQPHCFAHFQCRCAQMWQQGDVFHRYQGGRNQRFKLVDVKPRPGDAARLQARNQGGFVDDIPAFDLLCGTSKVRHGIEAGWPLARIVQGFQDELRPFLALRKKHLMYR